MYKIAGNFAAVSGRRRGENRQKAYGRQQHKREVAQLKKLFAKRFQGETERVVSVPADVMERDDSLIYAYQMNSKGERALTACVSIGSYDVIYIADDQSGKK